MCVGAYLGQGQADVAHARRISVSWCRVSPPTLVNRPKAWYRRIMEPLDLASTENGEQFLAFLERFDALMLDDAMAALHLVEQAPAWIRNESQWVLCKAEALRAVQDAEAAAAYLASVVAEEPEFADAHHYLAELEEELGHEHEATVHQLETLRLDSEEDLVSEPATVELAKAMTEAAGHALAELPMKLRARMAHVPVLLQERPSSNLVAEGFDARALGLFEGPNLSEENAGDAAIGPTSITLFTNCLLDAFGDDEAELLEQVRVTVLHEVGHYFCLDEEQLAELGLD